MPKIFISIWILFCWCLSTFSQTKIIDLGESKWFFKAADDSVWHKAIVPGTVHTDLLRNQLIPDPFYADNEKNLQWIENKKWVYETRFLLSENDLKFGQIELIFEGLDTYSKVYVNNQLVLESNNMFRKWTVDVKKMSHSGENFLRVEFEPAVEKAKLEENKLVYKLPGNEYVFVRKAAYHFGWDWAPRLISCGIWKNVNLEFRNNFQVNNFQVIQQKLTENDAEIVLKIDYQNFSDQKVRIQAKLEENNQSKEFLLPKGDTSFLLKFNIAQPKLWWCNGLGKANLYHFEVLAFENEHIVFKKNQSFGLRTIELIQKPDSVGSSFYFSLNKKKVFAKGANFVPMHVFLSELKTQDYQKIIDKALDANFNMLRVWGGGIYENEIFYDLCDKNGIMVWQDFMFACAMYPGNEAFLNNVKQEIEEQVIRLRNHPSIVLWCGNNEIDEGWHNWGWQKQLNYSKTDSAKIYTDYQKLFHELIPNVLQAEDKSRPYHPSSPSTGWGRKESLLKGDVHYWGVWWGKQPFEMYKEKVGRFVSEYGFQGIPSPEHFFEFIPNNQMNFSSPAFKNHQKHPTGFETIQQYMERDFKIPTTTENYAYLSQLLQARGMEIAIEAHRKAKPYCMGSLYWQLNDCWPSVSWSSIDFYNNPKAVHYSVKKAFKTYLISVEKKSDYLNFFLISDDQNAQKGIFTREVFQLNGTLIYKDSVSVNIEADTVKLITRFSPKIYENWEKDSSQVLIRTKFKINNKIMAENDFYFCPPKSLTLQKPEVNWEQLNQNQIKISAEKYLAKNVWLQADDIFFSDNSFDLLPGESKIIDFKTNTDILPKKLEVKIKSMFDSLQ